MKQLSDNTIIILVSIAIILTLAVSFVDFSGISNLITGAGSAAEIGYVNVTIKANILINSTDPNINFGDCYPATGGTWHWSNDTTTNGTTTGKCSALTSRDSILIENIGNTDANVTVATSQSAATLIGGTSPLFRFAAENNSGTTNGCMQGQQNKTVAFAAIDTPYQFCDNLTFVGGNNKVLMWAGIFIPQDAPADASAASANLTFRGIATV